MTKPLEKEFNYYIENQKELVKKYNGKYLLYTHMRRHVTQNVINNHYIFF